MGWKGIRLWVCVGECGGVRTVVGHDLFGLKVDLEDVEKLVLEGLGVLCDKDLWVGGKDLHVAEVAGRALVGFKPVAVAAFLLAHLAVELDLLQPASL